MKKIVDDSIIDIVPFTYGFVYAKKENNGNIDIIESLNKENIEILLKQKYQISNLNSQIKNIEIWDKNNVIGNVIKAVKEAKKVSKYVLLSNQSSNYPTPELLEVALLKNNLNYEIRHTMLTDAEYEDNLGKETFFREYLYVIRGDVNE